MKVGTVALEAAVMAEAPERVERVGKAVKVANSATGEMLAKVVKGAKVGITGTVAKGAIAERLMRDGQGSSRDGAATADASSDAMPSPPSQRALRRSPMRRWP